MKSATLIIRDEVNVKFEGLDPATRRKISNSLKFMLPYAYHMPAYKLGRWDGCVRFCDIAGRTYLNLLDTVLPIIQSEGYQIEIDDRRTHHDKLEFESVKEDTFAHKTWPEGHPVAGEPVVLRDYQVDIVNKFLEHPQCLQEVATGAGKTLVTAVLSQKCEPYGRTIVIVPNKSLVKQTEEDYVNLGLDVGVYYGDRKELGRMHTICTWQSLNILHKKSKKNEAPFPLTEFIEDVICVIIDEVHQAKADVLKTLLTGPFADIPLRWGLTGTIPKEEADFTSLKASLGQVVNNLAAHELQEKGVLSNCNVNIVQLQDNYEFGNYASELKHLVTDPERVKYLSKMFKTINESGNTLILVDRIKTGQILMDHLPEAVFISGEVDVDSRKEHYDEVKDAQGKIIVATYGVASVGINIPRIFNLVLLEPGKSFVRVIQSIGRGIRKAEDKDHVEIWDITSSCKYSKRHLTQRKKFYKEAHYPFAVEKLKWETK